jgi:hypothetical protein
MTEPSHPLFKPVAEKVLAGRESFYFDEAWDLAPFFSPWHSHSFCLAILKRDLDNTEPTGATYRADGDGYVRSGGGGSSTCGLPAFLREPSKRKESAVERRCDKAALQLSEMIFTAPPYHPLAKNADERLEALKKALETDFRQYRRLSHRECELLELPGVTPVFVPNIGPLGRIATAKDVAAGAAVFQLGGEGTLSDIKLPAVTSIKHNVQPPDAEVTHALIVQAEVDTEGQLHLGILRRGGMQEVRRDQVGEIVAIPVAPEEQQR